jgi:predicted  nucleic acid-binding Zn-ribbon protein
MDDAATRRPRLSLLESVRCLECGEVYSKPSEGGTMSRNPGCPLCGYVGWLSVSLPAAARGESRRFGADPLRHRSARSG